MEALTVIHSRWPHRKQLDMIFQLISLTVQPPTNQETTQSSTLISSECTVCIRILFRLFLCHRGLHRSFYIFTQKKLYILTRKSLEKSWVCWTWGPFYEYLLGSKREWFLSAIDFVTVLIPNMIDRSVSLSFWHIFEKNKNPLYTGISLRYVYSTSFVWISHCISSLSINEILTNIHTYMHTYPHTNTDTLAFSLKFIAF